MVDPDRAGMPHHRPQGRAQRAGVGGQQAPPARAPPRSSSGPAAPADRAARRRWRRRPCWPGPPRRRHRPAPRLPRDRRRGRSASRPPGRAAARRRAAGRPAIAETRAPPRARHAHERSCGRPRRRASASRQASRQTAPAGPPPARCRLGQRLEAAEPLQLRALRMAPLPEIPAERGLLSLAQMELAEVAPKALQGGGLVLRDRRPVDLAAARSRSAPPARRRPGPARPRRRRRRCQSSLNQRRLDGE